MKTVTILNHAAGESSGSNPGDITGRLRKLFSQFGIESEIIPASRSADLAALTRRAVDAGPDAVLAGGGDGTVSAVSSVLAHTGISLGILPLGTLNHFAKDLQIPIGLEGAIELIAKGRCRKVDLGEVNGRYFINNSSIGIYPRLVKNREEQRLRLGIGKWPALALAVFKVFRRFPELRVELLSEGLNITRRTPFVFVGNNVYNISLFTVRNRSVIDAGVLSVYIANRGGRFELLRILVRTLTGRLDQARDFTALTLRDFRVLTKGRRPVRVALDGEIVRMSPPLHYVTRPDALKVIAPAPEIL